MLLIKIRFKHLNIVSSFFDIAMMTSWTESRLAEEPPASQIETAPEAPPLKRCVYGKAMMVIKMLCVL